MQDLIFQQQGKDGYYKIWHTPEKNIFLFVQSGEGSIVLREKSYPITQGVLCFIGSRKYHYTFPQEPSQYIRSKLMIDSSSLEKLSLTLGLFDRFHEEMITIAILFGEEYNHVARLFERLKRSDADESYQQAERYATAAELMVILAKNATTEGQSNPDPLQKAIHYVNRHISKDLTLEEISANCYISKYYLCRTFKKRMGLTVMEYILQTRITMAKELLQKGLLSVTQVSIACGFSSPSYFSRIFKKETGISPMTYRKRIHN